MASRNKDPGAPPGSQSVSSSRWVLNSVASHSIGVPVGGKAAVDQHRAGATIIGSDAVMSLVRSDHARGNGNDEGEGDQSVRKHFQPPIRKIVPQALDKIDPGEAIKCEVVHRPQLSLKIAQGHAPRAAHVAARPRQGTHIRSAEPSVPWQWRQTQPLVPAAPEKACGEHGRSVLGAGFVRCRRSRSFLPRLTPLPMGVLAPFAGHSRSQKGPLKTSAQPLHPNGAKNRRWCGGQRRKD
jgi:hypothetical protein